MPRKKKSKMGRPRGGSRFIHCLTTMGASKHVKIVKRVMRAQGISRAAAVRLIIEAYDETLEA